MDDLFDALKLFGYCLLGFVAGIYSFFKGFRVYRRYRLLADIPEASIRGISMGLVEIHGKTTGEQTVASPVSGQPCYFYKVEIKKGHKDVRGEIIWKPYGYVADGVRFHMEDDTGKVLVDAQGIELDLMESGEETIGVGTGLLVDEYGGKVEVTSGGEVVTKSGLGGRMAKLLGKKDAPPPAPLDPWIQRMCEEKRAKEASLRALVARAASGGAAGGAASAGSTSDMFQLTEYCILPEFEYELTGTCAENPQPEGEHDLKMIVKGKNDPTFMISLGSEASVEDDLLRNAKLYIFGGACLSVASLAVILWMLS